MGRTALRGGGRPHDLVGERRWQLGRQDRFTHAPAGGLQAIDVVDIEPGELPVDERFEPARPEELAIGVGRRRKAVGDADAQGRQRLPHLAERGVLAADDGHVAHAEVVEPADSRGHARF